ncbi:molybdopterin-dependent oxidoreductase [Adlercreutzia sp. R21]|uniref:molybdopterin-dependent oxidoreductase n=1 Tax=Adlercreutzia wanghongyangiae TaxID=3111451 RepID=UPI002DB9BBD8|nr:molybdopterin-dependent oxidoreductase [Adlercreutzia sp. R21]MEC4184319.1 molybdopterin-dependent oxidoreductase [Adlercreutzia sp. R21]
MELTRRKFLAGATLAAGAAVAGAGVGAVPQAWADGEADAAEAPVEGENEKRAVVCDGCPAGCTALLTFDFDVPVEVGGEAANPFTEGALCARGQQLLDARLIPGEGDGEAASNPARLAAPRVRRAGSDHWEDISWDMALSEIASAVKATRDASFVEYAGEVPVMRTEAIVSFGGARLVAEEQYLLAKALRGWGVVHLDNEALFGRRTFGTACEAAFGIAAPDGLPSDAPHASVILTVGSDHAATQPVTLRWIERARDAGARWIVVDPVRTRTAEMADVHVALRPGTDTAFFGGLVKYLMDNNRWQPEYVLNYTNASYLVNDGFSFDNATGLFCGWDPVGGTYDRGTWGYRTDGFDTWNMRFDGEFAWVRGEGVPVWTIPSVPKPVRDITLQYEASVWMQMQAFYGRYDMDTVSTVCGVGRDQLEAVYEAVAATSAPEAAAKVLVGPGMVQHGTGAQAVRAACVAQLLLGNVGVVGGGIHYLGGTAGEGAADVLGLTSAVFPGGTPWPTEQTPTLQTWLEAVTAAAGARAQEPKAIVSALKEWWGEGAQADNSYGFDWLPKRPAALAGASVFDTLAAGGAKGCFVWEADLLAQAPGAFGPEGLAGLDWLVVADGSPSRTAAFWRELDGDLAALSTTVYQLPTAQACEKDGMRVAGSRLVQYAAAACPPADESRSEAAIIGDLWRRVYNLYDTKGGTAPDPLLGVKWDYEGENGIDLTRVAWALNGYQVEGADWNAGKVVLLEGSQGLRADGSAACAAASFAGCWNNNSAPATPAEQPVGRRDATDESGLGLFASWGFTWPSNVRVRGNRASANLAGQPWRNDRNLLYWDGQVWAMADQADFPALRDGRWVAPDNCAFPGVWEQVGLLWSDRLPDGPLPEHYEPLESPLNNRLNTSYASPVLLAAASRRGVGSVLAQTGGTDGSADAQGAGARDAAVEAALAPDYTDVMADREAYPICAVMNNNRADAAAWRALVPAARAFDPGFFVEVSPELARIRGFQTGDVARVFNERGSVEAPVLVTARVTPFVCEGNEAHYVYLNGMGVEAEEETEGAAPAMGGSWAALAPGVASPAGEGFAVKGFLVNVEKAEGAR